MTNTEQILENMTKPFRRECGVESKMYIFSDEKVQREKGNLFRNCTIDCIVDMVARCTERSFLLKL